MEARTLHLAALSASRCLGVFFCPSCHLADPDLFAVSLYVPYCTAAPPVKLAISAPLPLPTVLRHPCTGREPPRRKVATPCAGVGQAHATEQQCTMRQPGRTITCFLSALRSAARVMVLKLAPCLRFHSLSVVAALAQNRPCLTEAAAGTLV